MAVNRYDRAAEAPIINTYVPINFGELYRIGTALKAAVDQAAKELNDAVVKFSEFRSPSAVDTKMYYDKTLGFMQDVIDQAALNPDAMKDAAFRSMMTQRLNAVDYAGLSQLKQSRDAMLARQDYNAKLALAGKYNPLWHDVDFTNYDSLGSGIFSDISPIGYTSVVDLVKPYVDNLKSAFMGTKDGWISKGVSEARTDAEVMRNLSAIHKTPEYQKHLQVANQMGLTQEDLDASIIQAGREFAWEDKERDPMSLVWAKEAAKRGGGETANNLTNLTDMLEMQSNRKIGSLIQNIGSDSGADLIRNLQDIHTTAMVRTNNIDSANTAVIDQLSFTETDENVKNILIQQNTKTGLMTKDGFRVGSSSSDFKLKSVMVEDIIDFPVFVGGNFRKDFSNGAFKNVLIDGTNKITADGMQYIQTQNGLQINPDANMYLNEYMYIPEDLLLVNGSLDTPVYKYNSDEFKAEGATWVTLTDDQVRLMESTNQYGETKTSTSTTMKNGKYLKVPVVTQIARFGSGAVGNDAAWSSKRGISQDLRDNLQYNSERIRLYGLR